MHLKRNFGSHLWRRNKAEKPASLRYLEAIRMQNKTCEEETMWTYGYKTHLQKWFKISLLKIRPRTCYVYARTCSHLFYCFQAARICWWDDDDYNDATWPLSTLRSLWIITCLHLAVRFQLERALCTCIPVMTRARLMVDSYFTFFLDRIAKETFNHIETHHSLFWIYVWIIERLSLFKRSKQSRLFLLFL